VSGKLFKRKTLRCMLKIDGAYLLRLLSS
jgi:hypothetical protein